MSYITACLYAEAEDCFQTAIQLDESHIQARMQLAKLYETLNEPEQALVCLTEAMNIRRLEMARSRNQSQGEQRSSIGDPSMPVTPAKKRYYVPRRRTDPAELERQDRILAERLSQQYTVMVIQQEDMRAGEQGATATWMNAASDMIEDFRGSKKLYPWDKYARFVGYIAPARRKGATPLDADIVDMANRISDSELSAAYNVNFLTFLRTRSGDKWQDQCYYRPSEKLQRNFFLSLAGYIP